MPMSKYLGQQVLLANFTTESIAARPTAWEVRLHTGSPGENGNLLEVSESEYLPQAATFAVDDAGAFYRARNSADVTFPPAGVGANYTVTHFSVHGGGVFLGSGQLPVPVNVAEGGIIQFSINDLTIRGIV